MPQNILCWTDIPVIDLGRAVAFYSAVLGEEVSRVPLGDSEFALLPHAQEQASGCLVVASEDNQPSLTGPMIYLSVNGRMDAAAAAVETCGGKILEPKHSIGPHGFRVVLVDSEGNRLALHSLTA